MSSGTINDFPLNTILEYATSGQKGLSPQFESVIREISLANQNTPASELAVRTALDTISTSALDYVNLGTGIGIFKTLSGDVAMFNTIEGIGNCTTFSVEQTLIISGVQSLSTTTTGTILGATVQGGKYQYTNTLSSVDIETTGCLISNAVQDDVIGKVFVKCFVPFEDNLAVYSIGVSGTSIDKEAIVASFNSPIVTGMVDLTYSPTMTANEYNWLSGNYDLYVYRNGAESVSGQIGISVFYDQVKWLPSYGYWMGVGASDIQRLNLSLDFMDSTSRGVGLPVAKDEYCSLSYNYYIYSAGGKSASVLSDISRYDSKNDTSNVLTRGNLSSSRRALNGTNSSTKAYFMGGTNLAVENFYNTVDYILFSNDTSNASITTSLISPRSSHGLIKNSDSCWMAGGYVGGSVASSMARFDFADDTIHVIASTLNTACLKMGGEYNTSTYGYFLPGHTAAGVAVTTLDKMLFANATMSTIASYNLVTRIKTAAVQSSSDGYVLGGMYSSIPVQATQKTVFATDTSSIIESIINLNGGTSAVRGASV